MLLTDFSPTLEHFLVLEGMHQWIRAGRRINLDSDRSLNTAERFESYLSLAAIAAIRQGYPLEFDFKFSNPLEVPSYSVANSRILRRTIHMLTERKLVCFPSSELPMGQRRRAIYEISDQGSEILADTRRRVKRLEALLADLPAPDPDIAPLMHSPSVPPSVPLTGILETLAVEMIEEDYLAYRRRWLDAAAALILDNPSSPLYAFVPYYDPVRTQSILAIAKSNPEAGSFRPTLEHYLVLEGLAAWTEAATQGGVDQYRAADPDWFSAYVTLSAVEVVRRGYPLIVDLKFANPLVNAFTVLAESRILKVSFKSLIREGLILPPKGLGPPGYVLSDYGQEILTQTRIKVEKLQKYLKDRGDFPRILVSLIRYAVLAPRDHLRHFLEEFARGLIRADARALRQHWLEAAAGLIVENGFSPLYSYDTYYSFVTPSVKFPAFEALSAGATS